MARLSLSGTVIIAVLITLALIVIKLRERKRQSQIARTLAVHSDRDIGQLRMMETSLNIEKEERPKEGTPIKVFVKQPTVTMRTRQKT